MDLSYDNYIKSAIKEIPPTQEEFLQLKKKLSGKFGLPIPTNADLRDRYNQLIKLGEVKRNEKFEQLLLSRAIRTQSGVAVVAVLTKAYPCPGKCLYCPTEKNMPKSYLSNEPAVMRAIDSRFDPYLQVQNRLRSLELNGHNTDKIELIVMGGTFSYFPKSYQKKFVMECFRAANEYGRKIKIKPCQPDRQEAGRKPKIKINEVLLREQKLNEKAKHRIIGLTLETRPDYIDEKEIENFRALGCTRVELGVQSIFDDVLKINKRGHLTDKTVYATKLLKNAGFKINYHMMPGLPGSSLARDFQMFEDLFNKQEFQPDMLKIYPTVVLKDSALFHLWKKGRYTPLSDKQFENLALKIKNNVIPPYVRIARLVRDVPTPSIISGPVVSNLRQIIAHKSNCPCIRCREVRAGYTIKENMVLDRVNYKASGGKEIFLQYVSPDKKKLFALLRLRIPEDNNANHHIKALRNCALIREVHTYGKLTQIDKKSAQSPQHIGLGRRLLAEAERIAQQEFGMKKISVISGIGVRNYYRKFGYKLSETYLIKKLS